jgi:hypothetical protein
MSRSRHPHKEIEQAVQYAESLGWSVKPCKKGHAWARLYCPHGERSGCKFSVYSTPRNPEGYARKVRREVDLCPHVGNAGDG